MFPQGYIYDSFGDQLLATTIGAVPRQARDDMGGALLGGGHGWGGSGYCFVGLHEEDEDQGE
jgi:hypothetical protein